MGPKYHRVQYVVKVNLGPADICFELWHHGVKVSKDEAIKVEWSAAPPPDLQQLGAAPNYLPFRSSLPTSMGPEKPMVPGNMAPVNAAPFPPAYGAPAYGAPSYGGNVMNGMNGVNVMNGMAGMNTYQRGY